MEFLFFFASHFFPHIAITVIIKKKKKDKHEYDITSLHKTYQGLSKALRKIQILHEDQFVRSPPKLPGRQLPAPALPSCQLWSFAVTLPFAWNSLQPALSGHCFSLPSCKQSHPLHGELLSDCLLFNSMPPSTISNQSILKEINPEYSLEGLMLKLKRQYLGHRMWRADSLEKTLMLGKMEGKRRTGQQRMMVGWHHWLNGHEFEEIWETEKDREAWSAAVHEVAESQIWLSDWTTTPTKILFVSVYHLSFF